ncbi:MAG: lipoyl synthase [Desulfohalobiaceae bacterium]|nr:lipoyl synthase [Desulfohalobiaceae bacterium]
MTDDKKPAWLKIKIPAAKKETELFAGIKQRALCTVCVEAHCPNQLECFQRGTATFMLLGPTCTRRCTFCAVGKTSVHPPDPQEPWRIAEAVYQMGLRYCVLTMVSRDDLEDGGARHVAKTLESIHNQDSGIRIEVLISDLEGSPRALNDILRQKPDVLNHNLETVPRLYGVVRPQADYKRSLGVLKLAAEACITKSGLMLGLGETPTEVLQVMDDLRENGCRLLTIGQYLAPSQRHHPVVRYVHPEEFARYDHEARQRGFSEVASAPLVRSSYRAEELFERTRIGSVYGMKKSLQKRSPGNRPD